MSACTFLASDSPLPAVSPAQDYPLEINLDTGSICDGGADGNYHLLPFAEAEDYTDRKYGVCLEWNYTEGRAAQIIEYIRTALQHTDSIELWHIWLLGYWEFEDRPFIHRKTISIGELLPEHIRDIDRADIWNTPDKLYPERPSFYCLTITR